MKSTKKTVSLAEGLQLVHDELLTNLVAALGAFVIGKDDDGLSEDALDAKMEEEINLELILGPLLAQDSLSQEALEDVLSNTSLFDDRTIGHILSVLEFFQSGKTDLDEKSGDDVMLFLKETDAMMRLSFLLQDIEEGILAYGRSYYEILDEATFEDATDILNVFSPKTKEEYLQELRGFFVEGLDDGKDTKAMKRSLRQILSRLRKEI